MSEEENKKLTPTVLDILQEENEEIIEDYYSLAQKIYDDFDTAAYKKGYGYSCPNFPVFNQKIEGLEEGLYIFAGESNSGKTAMMTNLLWDFCRNKTNKLFGVYYSLDDSSNEVIPRLIAMNKRIPISVGAKPQRYVDYIAKNKDSEIAEVITTYRKYDDYLTKREEGLRELRGANKEFLILDRERIGSLDQLIDHARKVQMYVRRFDPDNNIIIGIDSLADVGVKKNFSSDKERMDYVAQTIKAAANVHLRCPIFTSYHVRKLNHNGRPTLDDIKETSRLVYEASAVFLIFNDVSKNKQGANIYYTAPEDSEKHPIIEMDWAKNKKSSYKGRTYHFFVPDYSSVRETPESEMRRFDALIYTK